MKEKKQMNPRKSGIALIVSGIFLTYIFNTLFDDIGIMFVFLLLLGPVMIFFGLYQSITGKQLKQQRK